jgi:hypothetical protein
LSWGDFVAVLLTAASFADPRAFPSDLVGWGLEMTLEQALRLTNRNMIAFDLALGSAAIAAPGATLRALGHDEPSPDAAHLFRRCGPIWLTFAAAHAVAERRGEPRDWWALAWLRGTEIATDALWARSPAVSRPGARLGLRLAGVANVAMAAGFAWLSRR